MAFPDSWNQIPIVGAWARPDGSVPKGFVLFETTQPGIVIEGELYSPGTIRVQLVNGAIPDGFTLPSTDDADLNITGWTYKVTEQFLGGRAPFDIFVPYDSAGEDLRTIVPVAPPAEMQSALSAAVIAAAQGFANRAEAAAEAAEGSEQDASNAAASEVSAAASAASATGSASSATASALAASTSASQAEAAATLAGTHATAAIDAATASEASESEASGSASDASNSATAAAASASIASTKSSESTASASAASASASAAATSATSSSSSATASSTSASASQVAATAAQLSALAAGAPLYSAVPGSFSGVPSPFLLSTDAGTQVRTHNGTVSTIIGWLGRVTFPSVSLLLSSALTLTPVGTEIMAGGYRYQVVSSGQHVTTAGGVKLVVMHVGGAYPIAAFGADVTGATSANSVLSAASGFAVADGKFLLHDHGDLRITANLTIDANLEVRPGATINNAGNYILTLNGLFFAQRSNVFTGTVNASFGPKFYARSVDAIYPEWFGAVPCGSTGPVVDCSAACLRAFQAAARSFSGYAGTVSLAAGIYGWATAVDVPSAGNFLLRGITGSSQIRGMDGGSGYPVHLIRFIDSTVGNRVSGVLFYSGNNDTRPVAFGIDSLSMKHTIIENCEFSGFSIAAIASAEWDNKFENLEISFCHVGIWTCREGGNNNDITIDTVRFVSCEVPVVNNGGANIRMINCQFQAGLVAPFTKTHIYSQGTAGFTILNCYFESQSGGGMAGMLFTNPEPVLVIADVIFNSAPYFTDRVGTVTQTLSQSSPSVGTVGSIQDCIFNSPAYYNAGSGGTGYSAGAVTITSITGTGTGAAGTVTVNPQTAVTGATFGTPGSGYQVGDRIRIVQGAQSGATAHVLTITTNGGIATVVIGGNAAVYPGHIKSLTMSACNVNGALFSVYNDISVCNPYRFSIRDCPTAGDLNVLVLGSNTTTLKNKLGNITIDGEAFRSNPLYANGPRGYFGNKWEFSATPTRSTFSRSSGSHQGVPSYRLALLPGQTHSDILTGSFPVASSGGSNAELVGRKIYMSVLKSESAANVKLRLTLSFTTGTGTVTTQNYDDLTSFTKLNSSSREEVSISLPRSTHTVTWTIQVIAATAGSQYVDILGVPMITIMGVPTEKFGREYYERPLINSFTYDPPLIAAGGSATQTFTFYGVRAGAEVVQVSAPYNLSGLIASAYVSTNNEITLSLFNPTGVGVNLGSAAWKFRVIPVDLT